MNEIRYTLDELKNLFLEIEQQYEKGDIQWRHKIQQMLLADIRMLKKENENAN